jgi:hypothetical protein
MPANRFDLDNLDSDTLSAKLGSGPTNLAPQGVANIDDQIDNNPVTAHANASQAILTMVGMRPELAVPDSPLSVAQRAAFGWMKYPDLQQKYLEEHFGGKDNVSFEKMDSDGKMNFVVKHNGSWKQVDPAGLSDMAADAFSGDFKDAKRIWKQVSIGNTLGGAAQFMANRGAASVGAAAAGSAGGIAGAEAGMGLGALGGPIAPLTMFLGGLGGGIAGTIAGGAAGGAAGEVVENGVRANLKDISDATGFDIPGAYKASPDELKQQVMASMLMGASQEAGGMALRGGANAFGAVLKSIADTPQGTYALSKLLKMGAKDLSSREARIWAEDPASVAPKQNVIQKDLINGTQVGSQTQHGVLENWLDDGEVGRQGLGNDFDVLSDRAGQAKFDPMNVELSNKAPNIPQTMQAFQDQGFINGKGEIVKPTSGGHFLVDKDAAAISAIKGYTQFLAEKGNDATYDDLLRFKKSLGTMLHRGDGIPNGQLEGTITQMYNAVNQTMSDGLHKFDPKLADDFASLNSTYSIVAENLKDINKATEGTKLDTFLKKFAKDTGPDNLEYKSQQKLLDTINTALGLEDPTNEIIQWDIAKKTAPMFVRGRIGSMGKIAGIPIPVPTGGQLMRTGQMAGSAIDRFMQGIPGVAQGPPAEAAAQGAMDKYLKQAHDSIKSMPADTRAELIRNPQAIDQLGAAVGGAAQAEQQSTQQIMQQAGALQSYIFGQGQPAPGQK